MVGTCIGKISKFPFLKIRIITIVTQITKLSPEMHMITTQICIFNKLFLLT